MKTFKELAINETLDTLQESNTNLLDNPFRLGSMMYFEVIKEARKRLNEGRYTLTEVDKQILETDLGEFDICEGELVPLDCPMIVEEEEKEPELNKPKVGGSKKYYVYVKDGDKVKKVTFGAKGGGGKLAVKLDDPKARKAFADRHNCDTATDKLSARYWSCRLPTYAKDLGLTGGVNYFW